MAMERGGRTLTPTLSQREREHGLSGEGAWTFSA
jgi:hypothetical protein